MERRFEFVRRVADADVNLLPKRATACSAGYDFYYVDSFPTSIEPGKSTYVKTGVKASMEESNVLLLFNRSSNPKKKGLVLMNGVGVIDADYYDNPDNEGEIAFEFKNISDSTVTIHKGDKLGQGLFVRFDLTQGDNYGVGEARLGGFGSTEKGSN